MQTDADSDEKGQDGEYAADDYYATYGDAPYDNAASYDDAAYGDGWEPGDDRAYWRRRFLILCGGVGALIACAWLLPGPHQPSKQQAAAMSASAAAAARQQALPPAATGPSVHPTPKPQPKPQPAASPTTSAALAEATHKASKPVTADRSTPSGAKGGACAPADIVLSLFTSQSSYQKGAHPTFSVYAVSTSASPCTLTYGAGSVDVVVTRQGHVVWDSAACAPSPAGKVGFTLGVPQVLTLVWNPTAAKPAGCAGSLPAGTGTLSMDTLDAVAMSHGQSSTVRTFKLAD